MGDDGAMGVSTAGRGVHPGAREGVSGGMRSIELFAGAVAWAELERSSA
jgi:hypothetical protein